MNSDSITFIVFVALVFGAIMLGTYLSYSEIIEMGKLGYVECRENGSVLWKKECKNQ